MSQQSLHVVSCLRLRGMKNKSVIRKCTSLVWVPAPSQERKGDTGYIMCVMITAHIGDGAGVGKGRTIAGIIYQNYLEGRKKALW